MSREDKNQKDEFILQLKKETNKAFIFTIPDTENDVVIPKSQCEVETEEYDLHEEQIYTVYVARWIAEEKKLYDGGIENVEKISKVNVKVLDKREKAIKIELLEEGFEIWFPLSQIKNEAIPGEGGEFELRIAGWLLKKKIEEAKEEKEYDGRRIVKKSNSDDSGNGDISEEDFVEDDIPF